MLLAGTVLGALARFLVEGFQIGFTEPFGWLPDRVVAKLASPWEDRAR